MALRVDVEENEIRALREVTDWRGKKVLEIGCGTGRLTRRLARLGAHIQAIEPAADLIKTARQQLPKSFASRVQFNVGKSSRLQYPKNSFDVVLFAWSL
jgi:2-polyprenyl-3-methyl-5-hydroxy-6-metoxy-1,4-benzoquinol methylase